MKYVLDASVALSWVVPRPFVTVDDKLLKNVQKDFPFVIHLATV